MKNVRLIGLFLAFCGLAGMSACGSSDKTVAAPTNLSVGTVTSTTAVLSWSGTAGEYQVQLNSAAPEKATSTTFNATGLVANTAYTWMVRAVDGGNVSAWVSGKGFTTNASDEAGSVSVNFGNGEEVWDAASASVTDYGSGMLGLFFSKLPESDEEDFIPAVEAVIGSTDTGITVFNFTGTYDNEYYFEYFSEEYWDRVMTDEDETFYYGDWEVKTGAVTITSNSNSLVSGTATLTLFDSYDYWINENDTPAQKAFTMTFTNVPVTDGSQEARKIYKNRYPAVGQPKR